MAGVDWSRYWGKSRGGVHPALYHMLDAGLLARKMVERARGSALRGLLDWDAATVGFVVSLHDLGKLNPHFQCHLKSPSAPEHAPDPIYHAEVTYQHLRPGRGAPTAPRHLLARALGAHHGCFPCSRAKGPAVLGGTSWCRLRADAIAELATVFGVDPAGLDDLPLDPAGAVVLAGLTAVCDWLASDKERFPRMGEQPPPLTEYLSHARRLSGDVLDQVGWQPPVPDSRERSFEELFEKTPRCLQRRVMAVADSATEPLLAILEAPMGQGKTEAALYLADRLMTRLGHVGLYVALPTMATSSQMFKRVCGGYLARRFGGEQTVPVTLLHGQAAFDEGFAALVERADLPQPAGVDEDGNDPTGAVAASSWFRTGKQGLLTPFAVGTIDQALLGALQTSHQFVRLYGLANKVVILDEVHAYDAYTTGLMERLIAWLRALHCSVILLSATLPEAKRAALVDAWGAAAPLEWGAYPRLTVATGDAGALVPLPAPVQRRFWLRPLPAAADAESWTTAPRELLAEKLAAGGCAAWICNTVGRAQEAYLALRDDPRFADAKLLLFHARFPLQMRLAREQQVLALFGQDVARPAKAVVVATQVIEQSLDLDFDVMISDPAPIDLLLQRAGRVQRHEQRDEGRPAALRTAELYWLEPPADQPFQHFAEAASVYDAWLLLRTWLTLREPVQVASADRIEQLVERVYGNAELDVPQSLRAQAEEARASSELAAGLQVGECDQRALRWPQEDDPFEASVRLPDDDADPLMPRWVRAALTRLGDPSLQVVCVEQRDGGLEPGDGKPLIPTDRAPDNDESSRLVRCSLRIAHRGWFAALQPQQVPAWRASPVLRHYRLAPLSEGHCATGGLLLHLDPALGVVYGRAPTSAPREDSR